MNITTAPLISPEQTAALRTQLISRGASRSERELVRAEIAVERCDILEWLTAQNSTEKIYWRSSGGDFEAAGIGVADMIKIDGPVDAADLFRKIEATLSGSSTPNARYYGGFRFDMGADDGKREQCWDQFGSARFVLPRIELICRGEQTTLAVQCRPGDVEVALRQAQGDLADAQRDIDGGDDRDDNSLNKPLPKVVSRLDVPEQSEWNKSVRTTLARIQSGEIEKLVLARQVRLTTQSEMPALSVLRNQSISDNQTTMFAFAPGERTLFLGATPELLYQRVGRTIRSEAIAGTRGRGNGPADDARLADELSQSRKDQIEVELVREGIRQALLARCATLEIDNTPTAIRTMSVQHLKFGIKGVLRDGVNDAELVTCLSPTPAVGGWPKGRSARMISELEGFDRGWYAGPVGWVSREAATFAVAIRSALVHGSNVDLYSGAGIVTGSEPDFEWQELETKVGPYLRMFGL